MDDSGEETGSDDTADVSAADRFDDTSTLHQSVIAPSTVDWEATHAVINDDTYVRTF